MNEKLVEVKNWMSKNKKKILIGSVMVGGAIVSYVVFREIKKPIKPIKFNIDRLLELDDFSTHAYHDYGTCDYHFADFGKVCDKALVNAPKGVTKDSVVTGFIIYMA